MMTDYIKIISYISKNYKKVGGEGGKIIKSKEMLKNA
jgi:hypothetical protein